VKPIPFVVALCTVLAASGRVRAQGFAVERSDRVYPPVEPVRKIARELYRKDGHDGIWFLGNMGFALRLGGKFLFIDPAVSGEVYPGTNPLVHGFPLEPDEFQRADLVLYSHEHSDHMDRGLFPKLKQLKTEIWAPEYCRRFLLEAGIPADRIHIAKPGGSVTRDNIAIQFVRSRHESRGTPYYADVKDQDTVSVAFLIRTQHGNVFHPGDTMYLSEFNQLEVDYLLLPINDTDLGVGWAATLAHRLQPGVIIPCHYRMWYKGGPGRFYGSQSGHPAELLLALLVRGYSLPKTDILMLQPGGRLLLWPGATSKP
jgi:L-ascorbate metabolism protein UlaG (beta-lactamase superfamily)